MEGGCGEAMVLCIESGNYIQIRNALIVLTKVCSDAFILSLRGGGGGGEGQGNPWKHVQHLMDILKIKNFIKFPLEFLN